jgi:hypothetical protein
MTGKSKTIVYQYLFTCEVSDMSLVENAIKEKFPNHREAKSREIYFYSEGFFKDYIEFIKSHKSFVKEIFIRTEDKTEIVKIIKKTTPSLEERGVSRKDILEQAKRVENDEFYTLYEDVEKEISMYDKEIWKNKVVFCNCDDAVGETDKDTSAFARYFLKHFQELGLKKLICTHFSGKVDLFRAGTGAYVYTNDGINVIKVSPKGYTGSFDDPLSLKILKEEADIVCTNPPFSRAADYWKITVKSDKKFLIISNITNPITPAFIPYFYNTLNPQAIYFANKKIFSG